jgi:hypothetical protein
LADELWPRLEQRVDVPSKYASIENKLITVKDGDKTSTLYSRITIMPYREGDTSVMNPEASTTFHDWNFRIA